MMGPAFLPLGRYSCKQANKLKIKVNGNILFKFDMNFAEDCDLQLMAELFLKRINLVNPLHCGLDFDLDFKKCPADGDADWKTLLLKDLATWRDMFSIKIPKLEPSQFKALLFWILSPYRYITFLPYT